MVVAGIDMETDPVTWQLVVTSTEPCGDLRGVRLVAACRDVQEAVVVCHLDHCPFGRLRLVIRLVLDEVVDRVGDRPDRLVQATVDLRRGAGDPEGAQDFACLFRDVRLGRV